MQFSLDCKQRRHKQNQCSASDSVGLIFTRSYRSTLLFTTPTTTPSLVKTSLMERLGWPRSNFVLVFMERLGWPCSKFVLLFMERLGWPRSNCFSFYGVTGVTSLKFCFSFMERLGWPGSNFVLVFMERLEWPRVFSFLWSLFFHAIYSVPTSFFFCSPDAKASPMGLSNTLHCSVSGRGISGLLRSGVYLFVSSPFIYPFHFVCLLGKPGVCSS